MKKYLILIVFLFLMVGNGFGQTVEVEQSFVDDATRAFDLVVEQRDAIEKLKSERNYRKLKGNRRIC